MRKSLIVIGMLILFSSMYMEPDKKSPLLNEIEWFIDTVEVNSNDYINQFTVYVLYAYKTDSMQEDLCYSMSYMVNASSFMHIVYPLYYINIDSNVIVVSLGDNVTEDEILGLDLKSLDNNQMVKIAQKLYPQLPLGGFTGRSLGINICFENSLFNRTIYKDSNQMPKEISIFRKSLYEN